MNIRQHVKRRFAWGFAFAMASWMLIAIFAFTSGKQPPPAFMAAGMGLFMAAVLLVQFGIRCLLCGGNLGLTIGPGLFSLLSRKRTINYCPYCGSSLDEPFDKAQQAAAR